MSTATITTTPGHEDLEANKRLAVRWLDLISAGDVEALCRITHPEWVLQGGPRDLPPGHAGLRMLFASFGQIEQTWTVEDVIAEGDKVVVRATNRCVQDSFLGVPGRGIQQVFSAMFILRVVDGVVVRTWRNADDLQRVLQLGATVSPPSRRPSIP
jgi:ketosteroid isomerase-like protein